MLQSKYHTKFTSPDTVTVTVTRSQDHKEHGRRFENNDVIQHI